MFSSRPCLNINSFLNNLASGGTNRVSTLSESACNIGSLVNEITVGELSSNVDESRLVSGDALRSSLRFSSFLFLFNNLLLSSIGGRGVGSRLLLFLLDGSISRLRKESTIGVSELITFVTRVV